MQNSQVVVAHTCNPSIQKAENAKNEKTNNHCSSTASASVTAFTPGSCPAWVSTLIYFPWWPVMWTCKMK